MRKDAFLVVLVATALLILPAPASAGTYDVVTCNAQPQVAGQNRAWRLQLYNVAGLTPPAAAAFVVNPACTTTSGLSLVTSSPTVREVKLDDGAAWTFQAPAATVIKSIQLWRFVQTRGDDPAEGSATGSWNMVVRAGDTPTTGRALSTESCPGQSVAFPGHCTRGVASLESAPTPVVIDVGAPAVSLGLECTGPGVGSRCRTADGTPPVHNARYDLQAARVTIEDLSSPAVEPGIPGGAFRRPEESIGAAATDNSGLKALRVLIDGVERHAETLACDYREPLPCPPAASKFYDLTGLTDGRHSVTTLAEDAAGNVARVERSVDIDGTPPVIDRLLLKDRRVTVDVADALSGLQGGTIEARRNASSPFVALPTTRQGHRLLATVPRDLSPSRIGLRVSATDNAGNAVASMVTSMSLRTRVGSRFRTVRNARARIPYGRAVAVAGRLTTTDGVPLPHQPIAVTGTLRQVGATPQPLTTAITDATGRFRFTVAAGPSRELAIAYAGGPGFMRRSRDLSLRTPAGATINASSRVISGQRDVRFFGRLGLAGTSLPTGGKIVVLQSFQRGRWVTANTARASGPNATWSTRATFSGRPGRFRMRLRIPRDPETFPYETGYSRTLVVRVR